MLKLFLKQKTLYIAIAGIFLITLLMLRSSKHPQAQAPLVEPNQSPYAQSIAASGIVEALHENIKISVAVSGLIKKVDVEVGQEVKEGDVLIEQDDRALAGQLLIARANFDKLKSKVSKLSALKDKEALSQDERDSLVHDYKISQAEIARLKLLLDQLKTKAPISGKILQINTRKGEFISTPINASESYTPPILMGSNEALQIRADVDEVNASKVKAGAHAIAFVKGNKNHPSIPLEFIRIDPYIIPKKSLTGDNSERVDTRVLQVIFKAADQPQVYKGQQLDVYIEQ